MAEPTANHLADHDWDILVLSGFLVITIVPTNNSILHLGTPLDEARRAWNLSMLRRTRSVNQSA